jgi:cell division protein FtsQ
MWDRPDLLNSISGALIAASVLLAAYGGVITLANLPLFPVRQVLVSNALQPESQLQHVTRDQIYAVATQRLRGTFFTINLEAARNAFAALPWVRSVEVRRTWPDRLEVAIEEQVAFATWSDGKLVNTHGELFDSALVNGLPAFSGPEGSEGEITRRYREFTSALAALGLGVQQIVLSPRLAWELKLDNGLAIKLGREQPKDPIGARLQRFVAAYPDAAGKFKGKLSYADLRYPQGFALQLPQAAALVSKNPLAAPGAKGSASAKGKA